MKTSGMPLHCPTCRLVFDGSTVRDRTTALLPGAYIGSQSLEDRRTQTFAEDHVHDIREELKTEYESSQGLWWNEASWIRRNPHHPYAALLRTYPARVHPTPTANANFERLKQLIGMRLEALDAELLRSRREGFGDQNRMFSGL